MVDSNTTYTSWADEADEADHLELKWMLPSSSSPETSNGSTVSSSISQPTSYELDVLPKQSVVTMGQGPSYLYRFHLNERSAPFYKGHNSYLTSEAYIDANEYHRHQLSKKEWDDMRYQLFKESVELKCQQHPELKRRLMQCRDKRIIHISGDPFWGMTLKGNARAWVTGYEGVGHNKAGKALMSVIQKYQRQEQLHPSSQAKNKVKIHMKNPFSILNDDEN